MTDLTTEISQLGVPPPMASAQLRQTLLDMAAGGTSLVYETKAAFQFAVGISATVTDILVLAVTGTYPPATGLTATPLWYKRVGSTLGLYGEITTSSPMAIWAPMYSTDPVNCGEFGTISDCVSDQREIGANFMATTVSGSSTITLVGTTCAAQGIQSGWRIANVNWATRGSNCLPADATIDVVGTTTFTIKHFGGGAATAPSTENSAGWMFTGNHGIVNVVPGTTTAVIGLQFIAWPDGLSGTDNLTPIQEALDFAQKRHLTDVVLPAGLYMAGDTVMAGWAFEFVQLCFRAAPACQGYVGTLQGACIFPVNVDRPAIAIGGYRASKIEGIAVRGRNYNYCAQMVGMCNFSPNVNDWLAPHLTPTGTNPGGLSINAPYVGICINPYQGAKQTNHYPNRSWPTWTPIGGPPLNDPTNSGNYQYGSSPGSDLILEENEVAGFGVNILNEPNGDGNGDFTKIRGGLLEQAPYLIAILGTQSRSVEVRNINSDGFHTFLTNRHFNQGVGVIGGPIVNCAAGRAYQLFDIVTNYSLTVTVEDFYTENTVRIGDFLASGSFSNQVIFKGGHADLQNAVHGQIPAGIFNCQSNLTLDGFGITASSRISNLNIGLCPTIINGGLLLGGTLNAASTSRIRAINYCGGMLAGKSRFNSSLAYNLKTFNQQGSYYTAPTDILSGVVVGSLTSYDNATGHVVLSLLNVLPDSLEVGDQFIVQNLTGTGFFASLNGVQTSTFSSTGTQTIKFTVTPVGVSTITGGQISVFPVPIVTGGTYNNTTGEVIITAGRSAPEATGQQNVVISGITGTGTNLAQANGTFYLSYSGGSWVGTTLHYFIAPGLGSISITGGFINGYGGSSFPYDNAFRVRGVPTRWQMTQYLDTYIDDKLRSWRMSVPPEQPFNSITPSYNKDIVTIQYDSVAESSTIANVWTPGDMVYHINSGTIYVVLTVSAIGVPSGTLRTITLEQQNNLLLSNNGTWIANRGATGGADDNTLWLGESIHIATGAKIPTKLFWGTYSTNSININTISGGDGSANDLAAYYAVGDIIFGEQTLPLSPIPPSGCRIATVTYGVPGSMTLSANTNTTFAAVAFPIFPYELR